MQRRSRLILFAVAGVAAALIAGGLVVVFGGSRQPRPRAGPASQSQSVARPSVAEGATASPAQGSAPAPNSRPGCAVTPGQQVPVESAPPGTRPRARLGPGMELATTPATLAAGRIGQPLTIEGVVFAHDCKTRLAGTTVHVWQTNGNGEYGPHDGGRLVCCYLQATVLTDAAGRFRFDTVRPGSYQGMPAHIHIEAGHPAAGGVGAELRFAGDPNLDGFEAPGELLHPTPVPGTHPTALRAQLRLVLPGP